MDDVIIFMVIIMFSFHLLSFLFGCTKYLTRTEIQWILVIEQINGEIMTKERSDKITVTIQYTVTLLPT